MTTYEATQDFPFEKMVLGQPQAMQGGGSYFTKLTVDNSPILLQLPKCNMKSGIVKTKRVTYCDLMYGKHQYEELLSDWVEKIEEKCQDLIDTKKHLWFSNELSREDLETMMSSLVRLYKSGTKALMRTYVDVSKRNGNLKCHIYDENERIVDSDKINDKSLVIPLVQIEGIKFTSRSFDLELKLHQLMILEEKEELAFNKSCMIKRRSPPVSNDNTVKDLEDNVSSQSTTSSKEEDALESANAGPVLEIITSPVDENQLTLEKETSSENVKEKDDEKEDESQSIKQEVDISEMPVTDSALGNNELEEVSIKMDGLDNAEVEINSDSEETEESSDNMSSLTDLSNGDLQDITDEVNKELSPKSDIEEIELNVKDNAESITLKKPNEVYYEIYRAAREKARHMRKVALEAYLEAKQIKTKYMLEDLDDSDEELDFEDEEMSAARSV